MSHGKMRHGADSESVELSNSGEISGELQELETSEFQSADNRTGDRSERESADAAEDWESSHSLSPEGVRTKILILNANM